MSPQPRPAADRFEQLFQPEPNSGCWLWLGALQQVKLSARIGFHMV